MNALVILLMLVSGLLAKADIVTNYMCTDIVSSIEIVHARLMQD